MEHRYRHGDIAGVPHRGMLGRLMKRVFTPHTNMVHWVLICDYIESEEDYVILESIGKGVAVGRLSWYKDYRVFRPTAKSTCIRLRPVAESTCIRRDSCREYLGIWACQELTKYGRAKYDWGFVLSLPFACVCCWLQQLLTTGRTWPIKAADLPYSLDDRLCCTEAAVLAWRLVGVYLVPVSTMPIPSALLEAVEKGILKEVKEEL